MARKKIKKPKQVPCENCPFLKRTQSEISSEGILDIEFQIRTKNGFVTCNQNHLELCAGAHSLALKDGIATNSALYKFAQKKLTQTEIKRLTNRRDVYRSFEEFADEKFEIEEIQDQEAL